MKNLEYLKSLCGKPLKQGDAIREGASRGIIALEIIAEELCKMNVRKGKMSTYVEQSHNHTGSRWDKNG